MASTFDTISSTSPRHLEEVSPDDGLKARSFLIGIRRKTEVKTFRFCDARRTVLATTVLLVGMALLVPASSPDASPIIDVLDYQGFAWMGDPLAAPGSGFGGVGTVDEWSFPFHDPSKFYTWVMSDLVSLGGSDLGGVYYAQYSGGMFSIYEDDTADYTYDSVPGSGVAEPTGFDDGTLWLQAQFDLFEYYWDPGMGLGAFQGTLQINGGSAAPHFAEPGLFTFGGTTTGAFMPEGYYVKVDGAMSGGPAVPEPGTLLLLAGPLAGLVAGRLRCRPRSRRV
jgi:hypothetical protein